MKQINVALLQYNEDWNNKFMNSPGMYYCRLFALAQKTGLNGPFQQDLLHPYLKNTAVWLCPSLKPNMLCPEAPGHNNVYGSYRYIDNRGIRVKAASNYMWIHNYWSVRKGTHVPVSGTSTSKIIRPSKAMMFLEFPYWNPMPHSLDADGWKAATNVSYFDGHVKLVKHLANNYMNISCLGWEY